MKTIRQCAIEYGSFAVEFDIPIRKLLLSSNAADQLHALDKIAAKYKIARTLGRKYDIEKGVPRYEPILEILSNRKHDPISNPIASVLKFNGDLSRIYQRNTLSAASKFLWFLFGESIVIYDSQAVRQLMHEGCKDIRGNYEKFYLSWRSEYNRKQNEICEACEEFNHMNQQGFRERVFDWYLWSNGRD